MLDALHLRASIKKTPAAIRKRVIGQAMERLELLEEQGIFSLIDPILKSASAIDTLARKSSGMRCPALDDKNRCMIYEHRPLLCRIFGPTIRGNRRSIVIKGCGHFSRDIPETDFPILSIYKDEDVLLKALFKQLGIDPRRKIETIIPAAMVLDLEKFL